MLKIEINNQVVDTQGMSFALNLVSPIPFDPTSDKSEGSFIFGAHFPNNDRNRPIFLHADRIERYTEDEPEFLGKLSFDGRMWFEFSLEIIDATYKDINTNVKIGLGYFSNLITDLQLSDISWPVIDLGSTAQDVVDHANAMVLKNYPDAIYNFPTIWNPDFYETDKEKNPGWMEIINNYVQAESFRINVYDALAMHNSDSLVPQVYLFYILQKIFDSFGYIITGTVLEDTELTQLLCITNYALDGYEVKYFLRASLSVPVNILSNVILIFDNDSSGDNEDAQNCYDTSTGKYTLQAEGHYRIKCTVTCQMTIDPGETGNGEITLYHDDTIIHGESVEVTTSDPFTITLDVNTDYFFLGDIYIKASFMIGFVIVSTNISVGSLSIENLDVKQLNVYARELNVANHIPVMKISEFLESVKKLGIVYGFDHKSKEVELIFIQDLLDKLADKNVTATAAKSSRNPSTEKDKGFTLKYNFPSGDKAIKDNFKTHPASDDLGEFETMADLPIPDALNKYAFVKSLNADYFFTKRDDVTGWEVFSDRYFDQKIGDGSKEIPLKFSPLMMRLYWDTPFPYIQQAGNSAMFGLSDTDPGFRIMFWRGLHRSKVFGNNYYPMASSTVYDAHGTVIANYSLNMEQDESIHTQLMEKYYTWLLTGKKKVKMNIYFTASEIQSLKMLDKLRIFQQNYLIQEINIQVENDKIHLAECTFYTG